MTSVTSLRRSYGVRIRRTGRGGPAPYTSATSSIPSRIVALTTSGVMRTDLANQPVVWQTCAMERADVPTLPGLLERAAAQFPHAGVSFEDHRETYAELLASATAYAGRLRAL